MTELTVVGGLYEEHCTWPSWHRVFGSGGRAASAVAGHVDEITLRTYASALATGAFQSQAEAAGLDFRPQSAEQFIRFEYVHSLATPTITPAPSEIRNQAPIAVHADVVLRFGMLEGSAQVDARRCIYDPQCAFVPEPFRGKNNHARELAIVGNRHEVCSLAGTGDPGSAGTRLLEDERAEVVVIKAGAQGCSVITAAGNTPVPPYESDNVWSLGSGDVFAAVFAARWGVYGDNPVDAARLASAAVSVYANTMALPAASPEVLRESQATEAVGGEAYLASPFFTISQQWLVEEARRGLEELGLRVFSPLHEVGRGPAETVAPADLQALDRCDVVFAILDGLDSGTVFEVGYARALGKPVYGLAQEVSTDNLKMIQGSGCRIYSDLVTALHHVAWRK